MGERRSERIRSLSRDDQPRGRRRDENEEDLLKEFLRVSARDESHKLAGKLAWNTRRSEFHPLLASGSQAISCAVEAVAKARRFLGDDDEACELYCQPAFRDRGMGSSVALYLSSSRWRKSDVDQTEAELTVSKNSKAAVVAGAIAARAREGISPIVTAIGADAMCNAVLAVCRARLYLEEDNIDLRFIPTLEEVVKEKHDGGTGRMMALKMKIYVEEV